jgi:hypothetical protein
MFAMALALLSAEGIGCQAPTVVVVEREEVRKVVAWRLVERTYGETDPALTLAGDGDIPGVSKRLIYEPVYAERRAREYGCVRVRTACEHEIRLRILGGLARAVGESVTAECRIEGPEDLYHEIVIEPTAEGMELLEVRGLSRGNLRPGHYLIRGNRPFEMVFTSRQAGRGTMEITILQERGGTGAGQWAGGADLVDRHR